MPRVFSSLTRSGVARIALMAFLAMAGGADARDWSNLRVGVDATYRPVTYRTPDGKLTGFDVDVAEALCTEIKAKCSFIESSWEGIVLGLLSKRFDAIVSSMSEARALAHLRAPRPAASAPDAHPA